jgi:hypothetical protein
MGLLYRIAMAASYAFIEARNSSVGSPRTKFLGCGLPFVGETVDRLLLVSLSLN